MKITIGKKKINIRPLKWRDIISLEDEYDVSITKLTDNMTASIMSKIILMSLKAADDSITLDDINDLSLDHQVFKPETIGYIINGESHNPLGLD